jgi:hypothetical protein
VTRGSKHQESGKIERERRPRMSHIGDFAAGVIVDTRELIPPVQIPRSASRIHSSFVAPPTSPFGPVSEGIVAEVPRGEG